MYVFLLINFDEYWIWLLSFTVFMLVEVETYTVHYLKTQFNTKVELWWLKHAFYTTGPYEPGGPGGPRPPQFFRKSILAPNLAPPVFCRSVRDGPPRNSDLCTALSCILKLSLFCLLSKQKGLMPCWAVNFCFDFLTGSCAVIKGMDLSHQ